MNTRFVTVAMVALLATLALEPAGAGVPDPETSIAIALVGDNFELTVPVGHATMGVTSDAEVISHVRASQVVPDTWVDLHLSVTRPSSDDSTDAEVWKLLQSVSFKTR